MSGATEAVRAAAVRMLDALIAGAGEGRAPFRCLNTIYLDGVGIPMLMVGTADGPVEDGEAIVLLNPDEDLLDRFKPGVGYHGGLLKEIVSGKCDAMLHVWLDAYVKGPDRAKISRRTPPELQLARRSSRSNNHHRLRLDRNHVEGTHAKRKRYPRDAG